MKAFLQKRKISNSCGYPILSFIVARHMRNVMWSAPHLEDQRDVLFRGSIYYISDEVHCPCLSFFNYLGKDDHCDNHVWTNHDLHEHLHCLGCWGYWKLCRRGPDRWHWHLLYCLRQWYDTTFQIMNLNSNAQIKIAFHIYSLNSHTFKP